MSRSGLSTATIAASMPPPAASATLCQLTTRCEPTAKASERYAGFECSRWIESSSPSAKPSTHASRPSTRASSSSTAITVFGVYPSRRRSAIKRRRWGTVSSIALNANRNPTSALITANSAVDWLLAAAALANSFSS